MLSKTVKNDWVDFNGGLWVIVGYKLKCDFTINITIVTIYILHLFEFFVNHLENDSPKTVSNVETATDGTASIYAYSIQSLDMLMLYFEETN